MEIKKAAILFCRVFLYCFLLLATEPVFAQPAKKSYYLKDGKMNIKLSKNINEASLDSFIRQFALEELSLKDFLKNNFTDSIIKKGWSVAINDNDLCILNKSLAALDDFKDPINRLKIIDETFNAIGFSNSSTDKMGINSFRTKSSFAEEDSVVTFFLNNHINAGAVRLAADFTSWAAGSLPMQKDGNGWSVKVKLRPGKYLYKFVVDGKWTIDDDNKLTENDYKGNTNSVYYKCNTSFLLDGYTSSKKVLLSGSFINWNPQGVKMFKTRRGWALNVYLPEGTHTYRYIVDGNWMADPSNPDVLPNEFDDVNSVKRIGDSYKFMLEGFTTAKKVFLVGSFNNWRQFELPMNLTSNGWKLSYAIAPGNYTFKFKVDNDLYNADGKKVNGDGQSSILVIQPNHRFILKGFADANKVIIAGDFNGWNEKEFLLKRNGNDWFIDMHLAKGKHRYKFIVDGKWVLDPGNKLWEQNEFGTGNSVIWID